ncbi:MAG: EAL domain-containing protein [Betaproteobacteria bacterium]|nr:EAL domain-containing protein [Betaproteobacteria bacterium]
MASDARTKASEDGKLKAYAAKHLISALKRDQFVLYGQVIQSLQPRPSSTRYVEVLVRFLEEEQKLIPPGSFIPILEEAGLMPMLDRWVVKSLLQWMAKMRDEARGSALLRASVNLCADTLKDPHFAAFVHEQVVSSKVPAGKLSFELSQQTIAMHPEKFLPIARVFVPLGCSLAVSGFDGSLASLVALRKAGVRFVKLNGALARGLQHKPENLEKIKAIASACAALGMRSVAEMVEEPETIPLLREAGVDYAQGFGVARPALLQSLG